MNSEKTIGQILIFADQTQQQVLGFDRRAAELAGFVASEEYNPPCSFSYLSNIIFDSLKCRNTVLDSKRSA